MEDYPKGGSGNKTPGLKVSQSLSHLNTYWREKRPKENNAQYQSYNNVNSWQWHMTKDVITAPCIWSQIASKSGHVYSSSY